MGVPAVVEPVHRPRSLRDRRARGQREKRLTAALAAATVAVVAADITWGGGAVDRVGGRLDAVGRALGGGFGFLGGGNCGSGGGLGRGGGPAPPLRGRRGLGGRPRLVVGGLAVGLLALDAAPHGGRGTLHLLEDGVAHQRGERVDALSGAVAHVGGLGDGAEQACKK